MANKGQWSVFEWQYLDERGNVKPTSVWNFKDVNSERGTEVFEKYLGFNKADFPNPKPVGTIERILQIATDKDSIVLDSFAGSGTTAHAVLNLNKADGGNRKFILVEMMDYADSITAERVKRVIDGYGEGKKRVDGTGGDFSFYEVGEAIFSDGVLNEDIEEEKIRAYIWYTETHTHYQKPTEGSHAFLGCADGTAVYFHYRKGETTTLDAAFLKGVKEKAERYVIYADVCVLSPKMMEKWNIEFRKIPRDIKRV
ncbi:MAG: site-specific DNA-methyltransferase [Schwartzia sp.]|nr:site-specific DNA-methyltransferase [Schwartzia sp. (in: firmicutes)]